MLHIVELLFKQINNDDFKDHTLVSVEVSAPVLDVYWHVNIVLLFPSPPLLSMT